MYTAHWGLKFSPFSTPGKPASFFASPTHDEALARLQFIVQQRRQLGLLTGAAGNGKSLLLEVFGQQMRGPQCEIVVFSVSGIGGQEFLWNVADHFGLHLSANDTTFRLWRSIADHLFENRYQMIDTVFLLDDVDECESDTIALIAQLTQLALTSGNQLTTVVTAQSGRVKHLGPRLLELAELRIEVEAWEATDTVNFLSHCLEQAGSTASIFSTTAANRLHELSEGIPRRTCQLAHLALLAGARQALSVIDDSTVEWVHDELGINRR